MITSDKGGRRADDTTVSDLKRAGLPVASLVRPAKLTAIEPARVIREAGMLTKADLTRVLETMSKFLR